MKRLFIIPLLLLLGACQTVQNVTPTTPRARLATAEIVFQGALKEVINLTQTGVIKPGSTGAVAVAQAIIAVDTALIRWRASPDDPNLVQIGMDALTSLLNMLTAIKQHAEVVGGSGCPDIFTRQYHECVGPPEHMASLVRSNEISADMRTIA